MGRPRGYEWRKSETLYHATTGARAILDGGFKTRRQLGTDVHATGGGTDSAISLTSDLRVAQAIVLGLRVGRLIGRGEIELGEMIIQGSQIAPKGNALALATDSIKSPEFVQNVDRGLWPFRWGYGYGPRSISINDAQLEALVAAGLAEQMQEKFSSPLATKPMWIDGWAPMEALMEFAPNYYPWRFHWEYYKNLLGQGGMATDELYDPLFFSTNVGALGQLNEDDIAVLEMKVDADWLCAAPKDAERMGFEPRLIYGATASWSDSCENHLDMEARGFTSGFGGSRPREWDAPSASDTIAYLGQAMAEFRVYDPSLIKNIRLRENVDDVLDAARDEWGDRRLTIDEPLAWPYFKPRTRYLR
jgi:hypothetical protein